jgi:alkylhydroperoxidase/carboxymuconolactone decarboxylase family protein YurZ
LGTSTSIALKPRLTEFNEALQDFITRYAWGEIWTRSELSLRVRSLITLALHYCINPNVNCDLQTNTKKQLS